MDELQRATGALLGMFVGDAYGTQTDGMLTAEVQSLYPEGITDIDLTERPWGECGELSERSEMAILLSEGILWNRSFDPDYTKALYRKWLKKLGNLRNKELQTALEESALEKSESQDPLVRIIPLGIHAVSKNLKESLFMAETECAITHQSTLCKDSCKLLVLALAKLIDDSPRIEKLVAYLESVVQKQQLDERITQALTLSAKKRNIPCDGKQSTSILASLQLVFQTLRTTNSFEEGLSYITLQGGAASANAALYGALAGAYYGPAAIPEHWKQELIISDALERFLKKQTTHRRMNLKLDFLAEELAKGLF